MLQYFWMAIPSYIFATDNIKWMYCLPDHSLCFFADTHQQQSYESNTEQNIDATFNTNNILGVYIFNF